MKTSLELLSQVSVASPCDADWNEMAGDDFSRFCDHCEKHVYNLSALTTDAAINLIREKEGNLCGRFFRRADGTMLTADCPVGLHHKIKRKRRLAVLATSLAGFLSLNGCTRFDDAGNSTTPTPPAKQEKVEKQCIMGEPQVPAGILPIPVAGGICPPKELMGKVAPQNEKVEVKPAIPGPGLNQPAERADAEQPTKGRIILK